MVTIAKRLRLLFIIGLVFSIALLLFGFIQLNETNADIADISQVVAIICFLGAGALFLLALIDLFKKPNEIILYNEKTKEFLIKKYKNAVSSGKELFLNELGFFVLPVKDIIFINSTEKVERRTKIIGGAVGYAATVRSGNQLMIDFQTKSGGGKIIVKNLNPRSDIVKKHIFKILEENKKPDSF